MEFSDHAPLRVELKDFKDLNNRNTFFFSTHSNGGNTYPVVVVMFAGLLVREVI